MASYQLPRSSNSQRNERYKWKWKSNTNPYSNSEPPQWSTYSDLENLIIEDAYQNNEPRAVLDKYYIDFASNLQILISDGSKRRPVKRERLRDDFQNIRIARFADLPVEMKSGLGGQYGWVSAFIVEVRRHFRLEPGDLPSKKPSMLPTWIERTAHGLVEEGRLIGKLRECEQMAKMLLANKHTGMKEVWKLCAYFYTLESFLYKTLNAAMRAVGEKGQESIWRSKIPTLGPFCLLLWDDPYNRKLSVKKILYRGAMLEPSQIAKYQAMAADKDAWGSFQAYTSCTRKRETAMKFGNTLFIMEVLFAFIADLSPLSEYRNEEEELITPGVCFRVTKIERDRKNEKYAITLQLRQRFSSELNFFRHVNGTVDIFLRKLNR